ncbi:rhinocerosin-like [Atheta coriaria]|uniref:rhinocerosin-like n=1 Tax=Dalotia coriaria TaxID=877792 RepID=UPI0031F37C4B
MFIKLGLFLALAAIAVAYPSNLDALNAYEDEFNGDLNQYVPLEDVDEYEPLYLVRARREIQIDPHINKQDGTTNAGGSVTHRGDNHEVTGHWNKNVAGPGRSRANYGVRGSFKW